MLLIQQPAFATIKECKAMEKALLKVVEKAENKFLCTPIGAAFETECTSLVSAATSGAGTAPAATICGVASARITAVCLTLGAKATKAETKSIADDICDYVYPDSSPYIIVENHLNKHKVDFQADIKNGDDVHLRGNNWLGGKEIGILASHKLETDRFHNKVKARVKISCDESLLPLHPDKYRKSCKDKKLHIDNVEPNKHLVYVNYKDEKYHIHKKKLKPSFGTFIPIENNLKEHKVDFSVIIDNSPNVHLPGNNWLKPGKKATLYSYKLFRDRYTVKVRIKKGGRDITKTIDGVRPGVNKVIVYYKNGKYHVRKAKITAKFYANRAIVVENHLKKYKDKNRVDFRVVIDNGPDVHLAGNNWLNPGKKNVLMDHRLYRNSYIVKARVDITGIDKHLSIDGVHPGKHKVYVYKENGEYKIKKKTIKSVK